jgi:hypothetical protein
LEAEAVLVVGDAAIASQKPAYEKQAKARRNVAVRSFILDLQGTHLKEYPDRGLDAIGSDEGRNGGLSSAMDGASNATTNRYDGSSDKWRRARLAAHLATTCANSGQSSRDPLIVSLHFVSS